MKEALPNSGSSIGDSECFQSQRQRQTGFQGQCSDSVGKTKQLTRTFLCFGTHCRMSRQPLTDCIRTSVPPLGLF